MSFDNTGNGKSCASTSLEYLNVPKEDLGFDNDLKMQIPPPLELRIPPS